MQFPLYFTFKISTITNDFRVHDANGKELAFVRQKLFKMKEEIHVFSNEDRIQLDYKIKADHWLDFSATYRFFDAQDNGLGCIARHGMKSIWKAFYQIYDENQKPDFTVNEENAFVKVFDGIFGELPIIGIFSGYFFNPSYIVTRPDGNQIVRLQKEKSFFGRRFTVNKLAEFESDEGIRILLSLMMMILLERNRG
ncbi:MAG: LURP-one-related/scramblase family protein [Paludibacteraceae bacterium]